MFIMYILSSYAKYPLNGTLAKVTQIRIQSASECVIQGMDCSLS